MITQSRIRLLLLIGCALLVLSCQNPNAKPVHAAVKSETVNANGFDLSLAYQTEAPIIIAHVEETQELYGANGNLVRTFTLDYWEWFTLAVLPGQGTIPANEWQQIQQFQGKNVALSDAIRTGPGLVAALVKAPSFRVKIKRTHTLYTGGTITGQGQGSGMDLGKSGFLQTDQNGNQPSASYKEGQQTLDITNNWRKGKTIQGRIQDKGTEQLKIVFDHEGNWQRDPANPPYAAEWKYDRKIGNAAPAQQDGSNQSVTPQNGP